MEASAQAASSASSSLPYWLLCLVCSGIHFAFYAQTVTEHWHDMPSPGDPCSACTV